MLNVVKGTFKKYPWAANTLTYGCMCVGAEFSQQCFTRRNLGQKSSTQKIDVEALKRYAVIGYCVNPHILYFWYKWLDRTFAGTARQTVVKKVLLDQFGMTPLLYIVFYVEFFWVCSEHIAHPDETPLVHPHVRLLIRWSYCGKPH